MVGQRAIDADEDPPDDESETTEQDITLAVVAGSGGGGWGGMSRESLLIHKRHWHPALTIPVEPAIRRHLGMGCRAHSWQGNGRSLGVVGFTVPMGAGEQSPTPKTLLKRCARARSKRVDGVTERFPKVSLVREAKAQK